MKGVFLMAYFRRKRRGKRSFMSKVSRAVKKLKQLPRIKREQAFRRSKRIVNPINYVRRGGISL